MYKVELEAWMRSELILCDKIRSMVSYDKKKATLKEEVDGQMRANTMYLDEGPERLEDGQLRLLGPEQITTDNLEEFTAQNENGVDADAAGQPDFQRRQEVLLQVRVQPANLVGVEFAQKGGGFEVLLAQRGKLEQLHVHQRHDDFQAVQAHVGRREGVFRRRIRFCQ